MTTSEQCIATFVWQRESRQCDRRDHATGWHRVKVRTNHGWAEIKWRQIHRERRRP